MAATVQMPYTDLPLDAQLLSPSTPNSTKPLPSLPDRTTTYLDLAPYRDDPSSPTGPFSPQDASPTPLSIQPPQYEQHPTSLRPYSDLPSPSEAASPTTPHHDDDVPLARLMLQQHNAHAQAPAYAYPLEAPPSYSFAVRQSFRDRLQQHFQDPLAPEVIDEEAQSLGEDEMSHSIEKVVAMFTVAILLLVLSGVMAWVALGSGMWD